MNKTQYCLIQLDQDHFAFPAVASGPGIIKAKVQRTGRDAVDPWFQVPFATGIPMGAFLNPILLMSTATLSENSPSATMPLLAEAVWMDRIRIFVFS